MVDITAGDSQHDATAFSVSLPERECWCRVSTLLSRCQSGKCDNQLTRSCAFARAGRVNSLAKLAESLDEVKREKDSLASGMASKDARVAELTREKEVLREVTVCPAPALEARKRGREAFLLCITSI